YNSLFLSTSSSSSSSSSSLTISLRRPAAAPPPPPPTLPLSFTTARRPRSPSRLGGQRWSRHPPHLISLAVATRPTAATTAASALFTSGVGRFSELGGMKASGGTEAKSMIVAAG
ncbi:hypothetical protein LINGRAHAP2_LOCUS4872, partial [Linum grandiflorum]